MASGTTDNTAVNRLIDLAQQRPVEADETLFEQPRRAPLPPPSRARGATSTLPPPLPRVPRSSGAMLAQRPATPAPAMLDEEEVPTRPFDQIEPDAITTEPVELVDGGIDLGFDEPAPEVRRSARHYVPRSPRDEATQIARMPSLRPGSRSWLWIAGAFAVGVTATALIAWPRGASPVAPRSIGSGAPPVITAPSAPAAIAPVPEPASATPIATAAPVEAKPVEAAPVEAKPVEAKPVEAKPGPRAATSPRRATRPAPPRVAARPATTLAAPAGRAVIMLGSKPPCEIFVDGKRTGLTTPQRALALAPGPHKITLVNAKYGIRETFTVTATAGAPVKAVKDLTAKMRR